MTLNSQYTRICMRTAYAIQVSYLSMNPYHTPPVRNPVGSREQNERSAQQKSALKLFVVVSTKRQKTGHQKPVSIGRLFDSSGLVEKTMC